MKVPPKRKGNHGKAEQFRAVGGLNESPSQKEGKCRYGCCGGWWGSRLNESPSQKEGKFGGLSRNAGWRVCLNESPSQKEGKLSGWSASLNLI